MFDRCLDDVDDEVRDRATLYLKVFTEKTLADAYVKEGLLTFMSSFLIDSWTVYRVRLLSCGAGVQTSGLC
jgi:hypothetical protein